VYFRSRIIAEPCKFKVTNDKIVLMKYSYLWQLTTISPTSRTSGKKTNGKARDTTRNTNPNRQPNNLRKEEAQRDFRSFHTEFLRLAIEAKPVDKGSR
jgi:hypothetical protein